MPTLEYTLLAQSMQYHARTSDCVVAGAGDASIEASIASSACAVAAAIAVARMAQAA